MSSKSKRKRVSREKVRENARQGDRGPSWFNLPEGVEEWSLDKAGSYNLDIVPYEVSVENHPDSGIEKGTIWYKRPFVVHHGVGANNQSIICPGSAGKRCPIHEELARVKKKGDVEDETLRQLGGQKYIALNMLDPEDAEKVVLFVIASGKLWSFKGGGLQKELDEGDDENLSFFDTTGGKTLKVRFSEESFQGRKFFQASRIDFKPRKDLDEDEILGKTVDIDAAMNVLPYDKIKALFLQEDAENGDDEEEESGKNDKDEGKKPKKDKPKKDGEEEEEEDDSDDSDDDDSDDDDSDDDDSDDDDSDDDDSDDDDSDDDDSDDDDGDKKKPKIGKKK